MASITLMTRHNVVILRRQKDEEKIGSDSFIMIQKQLRYNIPKNSSDKGRITITY